MSLKTLLLMCTMALASSFGFAGSGHDHASEAITIKHGWIKMPAPGLLMAGGFATISNTGHNQDRLVAAYSDIAKVVELHTMEMHDGVMRMRQVDNGWALPMGQSLSLAPGGNHIMFIGLQKKLAIGDEVPIVLEFEKAGKIEKLFMVKQVKADHASHDGHNMQQDDRAHKQDHNH